MTGTLGVACLGVTHPHASGRVRKMIATPGVRVADAADDADVIEPFTRLLGIPQKSVDELLADQGVHAVLIHSKGKDMTPLALRAMRAGKAVLVEKPGGATVADLRELAEATEETGSVCPVGFTYRFSPAVTAASGILRSGVLGDVLQVRAHGGCSLGEASASHINPPDDMGGAFWVIGSHIVDLVLSQFGVPTSVNGRAVKLPGGKRAAYREDAAVAILNYPERAVSIDFFAHGRQSRDIVARFLPEQAVDAATAALAEEELTRLDRIRPVPGAPDFISRVASRVRVAIVTSAPRPLAEARLEAAGVPVPGPLISGGDVTAGKPAPDGYLLAARRLGVPARACLAFEDARQSHRHRPGIARRGGFRAGQHLPAGRRIARAGRAHPRQRRHGRGSPASTTPPSSGSRYRRRHGPRLAPAARRWRYPPAALTRARLRRAPVAGPGRRSR